MLYRPMGYCWWPRWNPPCWTLRNNSSSEEWRRRIRQFWSIPSEPVETSISTNEALKLGVDVNQPPWTTHTRTEWSEKPKYVFLISLDLAFFVESMSESSVRRAMTFMEGGVERWAFVTLTGQYGDENLNRISKHIQWRQKPSTSW